jgi:hypothetical protein
MGAMSSSDSTDTPDRPDPSASEVDPAIAEAVDGVGDRFGTLGLEQMISYAEDALTVARKALDELADTAD